MEKYVGIEQEEGKFTSLHVEGKNKNGLPQGSVLGTVPLNISVGDMDSRIECTVCT